jgi:hypothetical protein
MKAIQNPIVEVSLKQKKKSLKKLLSQEIINEKTPKTWKDQLM